MIDTSMITGFASNIVSAPVKIWWIVLIVVGLFVIFNFLSQFFVFFDCFRFVFIIYILRQFFDIIVDVWKLPFAILLDALDTLAYNNPFFDIGACVGNIVLFWALAKRGDHIGKLFGLIAAAEAVIGIWIFPQ